MAAEYVSTPLKPFMRFRSGVHHMSTWLISVTLSHQEKTWPSRCVGSMTCFWKITFLVQMKTKRRFPWRFRSFVRAEWAQWWTSTPLSSSFPSNIRNSNYQNQPIEKYPYSIFHLFVCMWEVTAGILRWNGRTSIWKSWKPLWTTTKSMTTLPQKWCIVLHSTISRRTLLKWKN